MQHKRVRPVFPFHDMLPSLACTLLMLQTYLLAPLSQTLAKDFDSSLVNLAIPAFTIPFAVAATGMIFLKPVVDISKFFATSLGLLCLGACLLSMANSVGFFLFIRVLTGLGTGVMLPSALLLAIKTVKKKRSFSNLILIVFAVSTGMTFGPSLGGWLNGVIGWPSMYRLIAMLAALLFLSYVSKSTQHQCLTISPNETKAKAISKSFWRNRYLYGFVYLTGVFHAGVFVWITHYFTIQYHLDEFHIATDLFIFGLPGFVVTLLMYHYQLDKKVITILYVALGITAVGLLLLMGNLPLWLAESLLGLMSVGFGCSQPLFIGLFKLPPAGSSPLRPVATGSGILFAGYGSGPLMMTALLGNGLIIAILFLIILVLMLAYIARRVWRDGSLKVVISNSGRRDEADMIRPIGQ